LSEALLRGEVARGDAARITGTSERTARRILSPLASERLLVSQTPKGPVRLGLPIHALGFYFVHSVLYLRWFSAIQQFSEVRNGSPTNVRELAPGGAGGASENLLTRNQECRS